MLRILIDHMVIPRVYILWPDAKATHSGQGNQKVRHQYQCGSQGVAGYERPDTGRDCQDTTAGHRHESDVG